MTPLISLHQATSILHSKQLSFAVVVQIRALITLELIWEPLLDKVHNQLLSVFALICPSTTLMFSVEENVAVKLNITEQNNFNSLLS